MLPKNARIFLSFHHDDASQARQARQQIEAAGWGGIVTAQDDADKAAVSALIQQSDMVILLLSKAFAWDDRLMLEEFAYAAVILRKPFLPVWLDSLDDIREDYATALAALTGAERESKQQLLSALEMLTAKHPGTGPAALAGALATFTPDTPPYTPSTPQICDKPCEAYEGDEPYIFISYAHDDAPRVYPIVKELYEAGWDLWYDEGIKATERYLPVIANHVKRGTVFVLMLTGRCLERPFVMNYELEFARQRGAAIVPVLLEDVPGWAGEQAIQREALLAAMAALGTLPNRGERKAVPPAIKQNVVYDVVLPPKVPGFEVGAYEGGISIKKYVGNEREVVIPGTVTSPDGTVFKVTRIGERAFENCTSLTSIIIPEGVTSIGAAAFYHCRSLTSIIIPEGVTSIGAAAFCGCKSLTSITIPKNVTSIGHMAFYYCESLTSITIPPSVTSIESGAFMNCESLTSITIPPSVTSIESGAFMNCKSLTNITIPESVIYIAGGAFQGCPVHVSARGSRDDVVGHVNKTTESKLEQSSHQEELEQNESSPLAIPSCRDTPYALLCCAKEDLALVGSILTELYWEGFNIRYEETPEQQALEKGACMLAFFTKQTATPITTAGMLDYVKRNASRIIQVFLKGRKELPKEIIHNLQAHQAIIEDDKTELEFLGGIRESLRHFGCSLDRPRGFEVKNTGNAVEIVKFHPTGVSRVIVPKTFFNPPLPVTSIGARAFFDCTSLTSITIPESVTSIDNRAFWRCASLTSITIPVGVNSIDKEVFKGCTSLTSITIPVSVTSIGKGAFYFCESLTSITIPEGVTSIGESAFEGCESLTSITIPESVTSIGDGVFKGCTSLTIYCPRDSAAWLYAEENGIKHEEMLNLESPAKLIPESTPQPMPEPTKPGWFARLFKGKK